MEKVFKMSKKKKEKKHGRTLENHAAGPQNRKQGPSESLKMEQKDKALMSIPTKSWAALQEVGSLWMPIICFQDSLIIQHSLRGIGQCTLQREFYFLIFPLMICPIWQKELRVKAWLSPAPCC